VADTDIRNCYYCLSMYKTQKSCRRNVADRGAKEKEHRPQHNTIYDSQSSLRRLRLSGRFQTDTATQLITICPCPLQLNLRSLVMNSSKSSTETPSTSAPIDRIPEQHDHVCKWGFKASRRRCHEKLGLRRRTVPRTHSCLQDDLLHLGNAAQKDPARR
jgi:hypothetical protein